MDIIYDYEIFSYAVYGGVARYFFELVKGISNKSEYSVQILAGYHMNKYIKGLSPELVQGSYFPRLPKSKGVIRNFINRKYTDLWLKRNSFDIFHKTLYLSPVPEKRKGKVVVTIYDMITEKFSSLSNAKQHTSLKKKAIMESDAVICISENTKKDLLSMVDIPEEKISVVYLGNSLLSLEQKDSNNRNEFLSEYLKNPYLLYVGERLNYKNFEKFLEAYSVSKKLNKSFNIICFGAGHLKKNEMDILAKKNIPQNRIYHIKGDDDLLIKLYKNATALIYPSLYEGFGLPILEAMSLGCPVICSKTSSMPEVGGNAVAYFDPLNIESIVDTLEQTVFSLSILKELRTQGLKQSKRFTWEKTVQETLDIYHSLN